jgi:hypothetical protein
MMRSSIGYIFSTVRGTIDENEIPNIEGGQHYNRRLALKWTLAIWNGSSCVLLSRH